jgi:hypothetical protein
LNDGGIDKRIVLYAMQFKVCNFDDDLHGFSGIGRIGIDEKIPVPSWADANTELVVRRP